MHTLFLVLPTVAFLRYWRFQQPTMSTSMGLGAIATLALLATIWTMPWDNLMVYKGVWSYPPEVVLGHIFYIPIEEQLFFITQPLFTGLWYLMAFPEGPVKFDPEQRNPILRILGGMGWLGVGIASMMLARQEIRVYYMGTFLAWFSIPLIIQWGYGADRLWAWRRQMVIGIIPSTIYLCLLDAFAIRYRVWSISEEHTVGLMVGPLPIEEIIFFFVTNLLVVQGITLLLELINARRQGSYRW